MAKKVVATPNNAVPMKTKQAQLNISDDLKYSIIHKLLIDKFTEQESTIKFASGEIEILPNVDISKICDVHELTVIESTVAAAYWNCLKGTPIKWKDENKIPKHWKYINNRKSPKSGKCEIAIDPFNASLNYTYAIVAAIIKLECIKNFVDTDLGLLHSTEKYNNSLVYDLIEPLRGKVDREILSYFQSKTFTHKDFYENNKGVCRISKDVITDLVEIAYSFENDVADVVFIFKRLVTRGEMAIKKTCIRCKTTFIPKNSQQKRCANCV